MSDKIKNLEGYLIIENGANPNTENISPTSYSGGGGFIVSQNGQEKWFWNNDLATPAWELHTNKEKIEVPSTAFVDKTNPDIVELRTWVDANLTESQKRNAELYMIEDILLTQDVDRHQQFTLMEDWQYQPLQASYVADAEITSVTINGNTHPINAAITDASGAKIFTSYSAGEDAAFQNLVLAALDAAALAENLSIMWIVGAKTNGFGDPMLYSIKGIVTSTPISVSESYTITINTTNFEPNVNDASAQQNTNTDTINTVVLTETDVLQLGTSPDRPDYVWEIIRDSITTLERRINLGNIAFVSQAVTSSEALYSQLGNPNRPFSDPWKAYDAIVAKKVTDDEKWNMTIYDGDFTYGAIGSGSDRESSDSFGCNLASNNLTIHCYGEVSFTYQSRDLHRLFADQSQEAFKFQVTGHPSLITDSTSVMFCYFNNPYGDYYLELDEVKMGGSDWYGLFFLRIFQTCTIKMKNVKENASWFLRQGGGGGDWDQAKRLYVEIDHCSSINSDFFIGMTKMRNANVEVLVHNMYMELDDSACYINGIVDSNIKVVFNNIKVVDGKNGDLTQTGVMYLFGLPASIVNSKLHYELGNINYEGNGNLFKGTLSTVTNSKLTFKINGVVNASSGNIIHLVNGNTPVNSSIIFDVDLISTGTQPIDIHIDKPGVTLTGKIKSSTDRSPIYIGKDVNFEDFSVILPTGATSPIVIGAAPSEVIASNFKTNSSVALTLPVVGEPLKINTKYN